MTNATTTDIARKLPSVLIANRGEIAVRIIRACADAGIKSIAVYSTPDADALHVRMADEAYALDGSSSADTYLNIDKLVAIGARSGAAAVHPGYGFLSENPNFARAVTEAGMTWIGPAPEVIEALGNKVTARNIAVAADAPLAPGTDKPAESADEVRAFAEKHGMPIIIKAAFGGGGRGIKVVHEFDQIDSAFEQATSEAKLAFGRSECFVERFLVRPRHVEAQVLADTHGNTVVVGTRDCSVQRRHQKLVEEAPAPFLTDAQREAIHASAAAICSRAGYVGAGTVEYMVGEDGLVSFLEVNTRLQVEHPITEATTGVDLVQEQFRIAAGLELSFTETPEPVGHAFEFRINAEDPALGFLPTPGPIDAFAAPTGPGIRTDSGVRTGSVVPAEYDSLIAKLIVWGTDRNQALTRSRAALAELEIQGTPTVIPFHQQLLEESDFTGAGEDFKVFTTWIEDDFAPRLQASPYLAMTEGQAGPRTEITVTVDGKAVALGLPEVLYRALTTGNFAGASAGAATAEDQPDDNALVAPMNGSVVRWLVQEGDTVEAGAGVVVVEAMKMETTVSAPVAGTLQNVAYADGESFSRGDILGVVLDS